MRGYLHLLRIMGGALAALFLLSWNGARAAGEPCKFRPLVSELQTFQTTTSTESGSAELDLRKELLRTTIRCASEEALFLQSRIRTLVIQDAAIRQIQNYLVTQLDTALTFYANHGAKISPLDLEGTKGAAKALLEWRRGTFAPLADETLNFLIWIANQDLFKAAEQRLSYVSQIIISASLTEDRDVLALLQKTKAELEQAQGANRDARYSFHSDQSPQTILFIKSSLEHLSETYQRFFDLNGLIKNKILSR